MARRFLACIGFVLLLHAPADARPHAESTAGSRVPAPQTRGIGGESFAAAHTPGAAIYPPLSPRDLRVVELTPEAVVVEVEWQELGALARVARPHGLRIQRRRVGSHGRHVLEIERPDGRRVRMALPRLEEGSFHCFRASAYNDQGESGPSGEACAVVVAAER